MTRGTPWKASERAGATVPVSLPVALTVALLVVAGSTAAAEERAPVDLGAYAGPIRIEVPEGAVVEVSTGGDTRRLTGVVELRPRDGGLQLVNDVAMPTYLEGIAEVPVRWPMEALKAQAVAARTYAWRSIERDAWDGYDICATVACQVFHGRDVVEGSGGQRWARAVAETGDEVLLHDGRPILARYFSTSGGRTRPNEEVFPSDGAHPYLRGVEDPEDVVSPLHRWEVRFTREEMDAILARGERLRAAVPLESVEVIPAGAGRPDRVRVTGADGATAVVNASTFRSFVSATAPQLHPDRFPGRRSDGRPMPETLPSSRFRVTVTETEVVVEGRGYGHGVGMSQYGAYGKALAGMSYDDILAAYYGGLRPAPHPGVPARVRVGLAEGAGTVTLRADGPVVVRAGETVITDRALGTWRVRARGDRTAQLLAPEGYGAPLVVAATTAASASVAEVHTLTLETVVNKPAELLLRVADGGEERPPLELGVVDPGRHRVRWALDDAEGEQLPPGTYDVALRARDETDEEEGVAATVTIRPIRAPSDGPRPLLDAPPGRGGGGTGAAGAGILGAIVGLVTAGRIEERR